MVLRVVRMTRVPKGTEGIGKNMISPLSGLLFLQDPVSSGLDVPPRMSGQFSLSRGTSLFGRLLRNLFLLNSLQNLSIFLSESLQSWISSSMDCNLCPYVAMLQVHRISNRTWVERFSADPLRSSPS